MNNVLLIRSIILELIKSYETCDPFRLCQYLGIIVAFVPLVRVKGFYQRYEDNDIVYINRDLGEEEQTLVCAHELGHAILHKDINAVFLETTNFVVNKYENEADIFADLLISEFYERQ